MPIPKVSTTMWHCRKFLVLVWMLCLLCGCSFAPMAPLHRWENNLQHGGKSSLSSRNLANITTSEISHDPLPHNTSRQNTAREMLRLLQSRYAASSNSTVQISNDKASWSKTQMYLYRARDRLTMEQIDCVANFLDQRVPPKTAIKILQTTPRILRKPVGSFLRPTTDFLLGLWGERLFQEAVDRNPRLLLSNGVGYTKHQNRADEEIARILATKASLSKKAIEQLKGTAPFVFGLSPEKVRSVTKYLFDLLRSQENEQTTNTAKLEEKHRKALGRIIVTHPHLLNLSVESNLRPRVEFLQSTCGMNATHVAKVVHASTGSVLILSVEDNLKPTLHYLERIVSEGAKNETKSSSLEALRKCLLSHPQILTLSLSNLQSKVLYFMEIEAMKFPSKNSTRLASRILCRCPTVYSLSLTENIIPKLDFLSKVWGISSFGDKDTLKDESLYHRLQEFPSVLTMSLEGNLQPTLIFFNRTRYTLLTEDWELVPGSTRIPGRYMAASLYNRLLPRWHYCLSRGFGTMDEGGRGDVGTREEPSLPPPPLHLLVQASDGLFCQALDLEYDDFMDFKEAAIPRLKFSSQFDTWLRTGRPIQV